MSNRWWPCGFCPEPIPPEALVVVFVGPLPDKPGYIGRGTYPYAHRACAQAYRDVGGSIEFTGVSPGAGVFTRPVDPTWMSRRGCLAADLARRQSVRAEAGRSDD